MPAGTLKNGIYAALLPVLGRRCEWMRARGGDAERSQAIAAALRKRRAVGACVTLLEKGKQTALVTAGYARLEPQKRLVEETTVFRAASVTKMVNALLVFRLQTLGRLNVREDVSDFLGYRVRNPLFPDAPITLGMLLNHTSSLVDSPAYFASFASPGNLQALLSDGAAYSASLPGLRFCYSNLAAGMIGCMLEKRFGESYEALMQRELFSPLGAEATFDLTTLRDRPLADNYGVLPAKRRFDAESRVARAAPLDAPDPQARYLLASGGLYATGEALGKLALLAWNGGDGFVSDECLRLMKTPTADWPRQQVRLRHGMGLFMLEDPSIHPKPLWGHQGFAYGAVNGVFFDAEGNGFCLFTSGASEQRRGHLARVNGDLIRALL